MYPIYVYVVILKAMSPKSSPSRRSRPSRNPSSHFHQLQQDGVLKSNSVLLQTSEKQQMGYSVSIFSGHFLTQGGAIALGYMNRTSITFIYFLMVLCFSVLSRGQLSFLVQVQDGLYLHEAILEVLLCIIDKVIIKDGCQLMYL